MITVHYLNNSRAHRVLWLLEELGQEYEIVRYQRGRDMRAPDSLKQVHPLGKSPVIEHDGQVIAESGAIFEYLTRVFGGNLVPVENAKAYNRYIFWLHYTEGSMMPLLVNKLIFANLPTQMPWPISLVAKLIDKGVSKNLLDPQIETNIAYWEQELAMTGWFAGDAFSAADIMMSFPVEAGASRVKYAKPTPNIDAFLTAIRARPAYQRALERGGAYDYAETQLG